MSNDMVQHLTQEDLRGECCKSGISTDGPTCQENASNFVLSLDVWTSREYSTEKTGFQVKPGVRKMCYLEARMPEGSPGAAVGKQTRSSDFDHTPIWVSLP
jgi:hypothetical protein